MRVLCKSNPTGLLAPIQGSNTNRWLVIVMTVIGLVMILAITGSRASSQSVNKNVSIFPSKTFMVYPIKINEIRVGDDVRRVKEDRFGDAYVRSPESFTELPDWLSQTSFQVENVSDKPIVYLEMNLRFPETTESGPIMVYSVTFGRRPGSKRPTSNPLFALMPKQTLDIALIAKYSDISRFVGQRQAIETVNQLALEVGFIVFEDGTAWSSGAYMRQDPNNPDRYIPVDTVQPRN